MQDSVPCFHFSSSSPSYDSHLAENISSLTTKIEDEHVNNADIQNASFYASQFHELARDVLFSPELARGHASRILLSDKDICISKVALVIIAC